jgi:alkanesulfonate monooxygenase SsuD/methylene tetrahydromethanopterin reductase-like flavin-dependent oxidoreductase (luciferase family)
MKAIWTEDEASYHGEHVSFDRIWSWPKPGLRSCSGWLPLSDLPR